MVVPNNMDALDWLRKHLEADGNDMIREMVQAFAERLMGAEADALCGAGWGERSPERVNSRNGYRHRDFDTRAGTIELAIPKLRHDSYYPGWLLEPRRRAERALTQVVCQCYVEGVSTRRVDDIVKAMGIDGISKSQVSKMAKDLDVIVEAFRNRPLDAGPYTYIWLDALTQRVREGGRIVNVAVVVATAVNADGHREVLGLDVITTEDGAGWTASCATSSPAGWPAWPWSSPTTISASKPRSRRCCPAPGDSVVERTSPGICSPGCPRRPRGWSPPWSARSSNNPTMTRCGPNTPAASNSSPAASTTTPACSSTPARTCWRSRRSPSSTGGPRQVS